MEACCASEARVHGSAINSTRVVIAYSNFYSVPVLFHFLTIHGTCFEQRMFILYLFLFLPSFLFLVSLIVVGGFGEYFVEESMYS